MKKALIFFSALVLLLGSCVSEPPDLYDYKQPKNYEDGLVTGTLEEINIEPIMIEKVVNLIYAGRLKEVHSILIYKDSHLVFEEYFMGHRYKWDGPSHHGDVATWRKFMLHHIQSVTKSITSACIGIAIDKGFIKSVDQSIFDYLPEHQRLKKDGREKITIEHLLTMTLGMNLTEWNASYGDKNNPIIGIWYSDKDPVSFILDRPLKYEPGTHFSYFGGNHIILGEIIRYASGMNIEEFSKKYLFEPLGITAVHWAVKFDNGVYEAASGLKLTPRDMMKIGVTFLNKGKWEDKQIISEEWVKKSAVLYGKNKDIDVPGVDSGRVGYAYSWWTKQYSRAGKKINMFYANGWGGQNIMVLPETDMVVVFTGGNYLTYRPPFKILEKFIIPAIVEKN